MSLLKVFVSNSGRQEGLTHPFGYLKASSSLTHVTLFVMPYNYRDLLPLAGRWGDLRNLRTLYLMHLNNDWEGATFATQD